MNELVVMQVLEDLGWYPDEDIQRPEILGTFGAYHLVFDLGSYAREYHIGDSFEEASLAGAMVWNALKERFDRGRCKHDGQHW